MQCWFMMLIQLQVSIFRQNHRQSLEKPNDKFDIIVLVFQFISLWKKS